MSAKISGAALAQAMKELSNQWDQTHAQWSDVKSQEFEKKYLADLPHYVSQAAEVMSEIDAVLRKVRSDCEQEQ